MPVRSHCSPTDRRGELARPPTGLEFGPLDVEKIAANPVVALDVDMHGADEIRVLQRGFHVFQMSRQPQIVVGLVANNPPARLTKHAIAMDFTVARAFREVEEPDAGVGCPQTLDGRAHRVIDAIADDEDLESSMPCACTLATASGKVAAR
jgi:hypothetical protein